MTVNGMGPSNVIVCTVPGVGPTFGVGPEVPDTIGVDEGEGELIAVDKVRGLIGQT